MKSNIENGFVSPKDIESIVNTIFFDRVRPSQLFDSCWHAVFSLVCPCFARRFNRTEGRKVELLKKARQKLSKELDVVNLLNSIRVSNFVSS